MVARLTANLQIMHVITYHSTTTITRLCSLDPSQPILRSSHKPPLCLLTRHLRQLMPHGEPTSNTILSLYCEGLATQNNFTYLTTSFINHLQQYKWEKVKTYFTTIWTRHRHQIDKPYISG
jgi:hypothetical protein